MEFTEEQIKEIMEATRLITRNLNEAMRIDDEINISAGAGTNDLKFKTVTPGRVFIVNALSGYNENNACTRIRVGYWNGHRYSWLVTQPAPLVTETVGIIAPLRLRDGMYPIVRFEGCTNLDDIYASLNGYWIKA